MNFNSLCDQFDSILVLDTETTGFRAGADEIIEFGMLKVNLTGDRPATCWERDLLVRLSPGRRLSAAITELTGISEGMLRSDGVEKAAACDTVGEFLSAERPLLVAYNAQFDLGFLYHFLQRFGKAGLLQGVGFLDAMTVYKDRREYPHKLKDAVVAYALETQNTHRAIDDAKATLELLSAMGAECDDLGRYVNLFGYNPKYGVSGSRISSVRYAPQGYRETCKLYEKELAVR
ncbi:MAG: 3'-5' exonuclease [Oscillospiraceae bacterium]|nr:3'-5' exonuclease [Oscillospiraceae bacterium]